MAQATHSPDPATLGTGAGEADHENGGYAPPAQPATGATAGTPGTWTPSGSLPRANIGAMPGCVASPATAWTSGQRVIMGDGNPTSWSGTSWVGGAAPLSQPQQASQSSE